MKIHKENCWRYKKFKLKNFKMWCIFFLFLNQFSFTFSHVNTKNILKHWNGFIGYFEWIKINVEPIFIFKNYHVTTCAVRKPTILFWKQIIFVQVRPHLTSVIKNKVLVYAKRHFLFKNNRSPCTCVVIMNAYKI